MIVLQVRLIFGQISGQVELWSDVSPRMRLWLKMKFGQTMDQVEFWSDVPQQDEASSQVDIWSDFRSG